MPSSQVPKLGQYLHIIEKFWIRFSVKKNFSKHKGNVRSYHNGSIRNWRRQEIFVKRMNYTIKSSSHVLPWLSCHDLHKNTMAMQDRAKANHDLGKDAKINHVLDKGSTVANPFFFGKSCFLILFILLL